MSTDDDVYSIDWRRAKPVEVEPVDLACLQDSFQKKTTAEQDEQVGGGAATAVNEAEAEVRGDQNIAAHTPLSGARMRWGAKEGPTAAIGCGAERRTALY